MRQRRARVLAAALILAWRAQRAALCGQVAAAVLSGLCPVAAAWLLRVILDRIAGHAPDAGLPPLLVAVGVTGGLAALLPNADHYLSAQAGRAIQLRAAADLFSAVGRLTGLGTVEDPVFQDKLRFAEQAGSSGPAQVITGVISMCRSAITLAGFVVTLAVLSPVMTAIVAAAAVPAIILDRGIARRQAETMRGITHGQRRQFFYATLLSSVPAAKEIRLFGLGGFFRDRMLGELRGVQRAATRTDRRVLLVGGGLAGLSALVAAGGLAWAAVAASAGRLTVGDVAILIAALASVATALTEIISSGTMTYGSLLTFEAYLEITGSAPDLPVPEAPVPVPELRHGIELQDVWFRYGPDQPWTISGVSCFIPHGAAVALAGRNGAGKTTLVKLLCRFYDPQRGRILWDGVDLRHMDPVSLRDRISAVFQDYLVYELSAADNIGVGDLTLAGREASLHAAARQAGIHDTLAGLPRGYQTGLTRTYLDLADAQNPETGVLLSGGQEQRVALARAFLRGGRDLMILDESSAGLDAEAEYQLHARMSASRAGQTTVLISHRLNTVRDCDLIIVLSGGVLAEQGDHDTLMAGGGIYARLFSLQSRGYVDA